jgi:hypothetical protein
MSIYYLLCAFIALFDNILEHPEAPDAFADLTRLNLVNRLTSPSFLTGTQGGFANVLRIAQELAHMATVYLAKVQGKMLTMLKNDDEANGEDGDMMRENYLPLGAEAGYCWR